MTLTGWSRWALRAVMALGLLFIYVPLLLVLVNSFNGDRTFAWPPHDLTTRWWTAAWNNAGARDALWTSVKAGLGATGIALVLGTMVAFAVQRFRFFGRDAISLLIVLPIVLHGVIAGEREKRSLEMLLAAPVNSESRKASPMMVWPAT